MKTSTVAATALGLGAKTPPTPEVAGDLGAMGVGDR